MDVFFQFVLVSDSGIAGRLSPRVCKTFYAQLLI